MDLHADSEPEAIVISTSDAESTPKRARNAKPFIKSFSFLPSLLKRLQTSGTSGTHARKYAETKPGRQVADHRPITNYNNNYFINGGRGGSGGEGGDQGGDGGTGQGPTVYFGQPHERESSDFQTIRLGDLKLVKDVRLGLQFGVVGRQSRGVSVRRMYHAKIRRDPGTVTAVMYQGDGAEEVGS
ncbi:hypothetical protein C8R45DRAFT_1024173 [Mycena sanguinolenta]|nr:hypothetical protein C8R45DRAFT_1024173 [Mycena sanguinolenta]